jgi:hypothetical protein
MAAAIKAQENRQDAGQAAYSLACPLANKPQQTGKPQVFPWRLVGLTH